MNKKLSLSLFIILSFCFSLSHHTSIATEDDIVQIPFNEIQIAEQLYQQGKLTEAIASLKTSINTYQAQEKIVPQIYGLRNLSLIYLQQENWQATQTNIIKAIELTKQIENSQQQSLLLSLCLEIQGQLQLAIDKPEVALSTWQQSSQLALSRKDMNQLLKSEIKQVQALQEMGLYAQAFSKLNELEPQLNKAPASLVTAKAWQTMGGLLGKIDRSAEAESALNKALAIVDSLEHPQAQADILISQGNLAQAQQNFETALNFYRQATIITNNPSLQLQAYLAQLNLLVTQDKPEKISSLVTPITTIINNSSPSKNLVNQRINLATSLIRLKNKQNNPLIVEQLSQGYQEAQQISYRRGEADALGSLGKLYQQQGQLSEARQLTEKALLIAQQMQAPDLEYQWQWQLGQILDQQSDRPSAISAYSQAVKILATLRNDLVAVSADLEFNFRENVEPVYRELVSILLTPEATPTEISQARDVIEALQVAELDNFFRVACIDTKPVVIDQITEQQDSTAAIIYTIALSDRLEIILKLPQQEIRHYSIPLEDITKAERLLQRLAQSLTQANNQETVPLAKQAYNWLIRPLEQDLAEAEVKTLVFVLDSPLRSIPMAILHNGEKYLIEKYAIALSPGLQLIEPEAIASRELKALTAGLTEARAGFPPLKYVAQELNNIESQLSRTETLLNDNFTSSALQKKINQLPFPVVHLATHGQFSSQADNTFILTWSDRLNINQLNNLLRGRNPRNQEPLELLVLSACETLIGDKRATLGLAGIAVRAGARSTLATLWRVNDEATASLMGNFYGELSKQSSNVTKAEALRQAQLTLLNDSRFNRPYFWASYVLVGNWL